VYQRAASPPGPTTGLALAAGRVRLLARKAVSPPRPSEPLLVRVTGEIEGEGNPANFTTGEGPEDVINLDNDLEISVYPIPFCEYLVFTGGMMNNKINVSFFSMDGKLRYQTMISDDESQINTSDLEKGLYILHITDGNKSCSIRVVKE